MASHPDWHYYIGSDRAGPVSAETLLQMAREGTLLPESLVWKEGLLDWVQAKRVKGLFDLPPSSSEPPPVPARPSTAVPRYSVFDDVIFCEKDLPSCDPIRKVEMGLHLFLGQSQLKTLDDVKRELARQAKRAGGNCIVQFKYGQKSGLRSWLFSLDDVSWFGEGMTGRLPVPLYQELRQRAHV